MDHPTYFHSMKSLQNLFATSFWCFFGSVLWTEFEFSTVNLTLELQKFQKILKFFRAEFFLTVKLFKPPRVTSYRRGVQLTTEAMEGKTSLMFHTFYINVNLILGLWALPIRCQLIFMRFFLLEKGAFWDFWGVVDSRIRIK